MKKEKIFFHPIDGSGSLTISWSPGPKGDAVEAKRGNGVGFFSEREDLLSVIFDEVRADHDQQSLKFDSISVEIKANNGRITYAIIKNRAVLRPRKASKRKIVLKKRASSLITKH